MSRWLGENEDGDQGALSVAVFARYRRLVLSELERVGGLRPLHAVQKVPTVFQRARDARRDLAGLTLRERLLAVAREVADK